MSRKRFLFLPGILCGILCCLLCTVVVAQIAFPVGDSTEIRFSADSGLTTAFADGTSWGNERETAFLLRYADGKSAASVAVRRVVAEGQTGDRFEVEFEDGGKAVFRTVTGKDPQGGFVLFRLENLQAKGEVEAFEMGRLAYPAECQVDGTLGRARFDGKFVCNGTAALNVRPTTAPSRVSHIDRAGCSHTFTQVPGRTEGTHAAEFTATCDASGGGWSMSGLRFPKALDLSGLKAIRAVVHGDGKRQALKIQPIDGTGAARDTYITIDFEGWQERTVAEAPYDKITKPGEIVGLNIYYNGLPADTTVRTLIDRIEAICERDGKETVVLLEDFENRRSPWWWGSGRILASSATSRHGIDGAAFGLLIGNKDGDFERIMPEFEVAAGLPSPRFDGVWNKISPDVRRSYFFLTNFKEAEFDDALAIANRGGFDRILILQNSWTRATGHYEVSTASFSEGLPGLQRTVKAFKDAGFKTGFHFLAASIDPPDTYLTPIPDDRLVYGPEVELAAEVDAEATFLPTVQVPEEFPEEDGGYMGKGRVLRLGDELIVYTKRKTEAPFGFEGCRRGHLGTKPVAHAKQSRVRHLVRAYGYHMIDLDTDLLPEVAAHFAKIADACDIDMMYFDGSELLQGESGDHWYYNAKLQRAFYDAVKNKNMLMQGSSYSPYSWHQLARSASADGHGDLKGYLDQRSPGFGWMYANGMPLDIGWYYAYDTTCTIDMYEYILLATLAYDSSMSLQVSVSAAHAHPFTGELLDRIKRYEELRLSGRVTPEIREKIKIDPQLGGKKPEEIAEKFAHLRKEYRLLTRPEQKDVLQRVVYTPWQDIAAEVASVTGEGSVWELTVPEDLGTVALGLNVHVPAKADAPTLRNPVINVAKIEDAAKEVGRIAVETDIAPGRYLFHWPEEEARLYVPGRDAVILDGTGAAAKVELTPGKYTVRFAAETLSPGRVRLSLQPDERIVIP